MNCKWYRPFNKTMLRYCRRIVLMCFIVALSIYSQVPGFLYSTTWSFQSLEPKYLTRNYSVKDVFNERITHLQKGCAVKENMTSNLYKPDKFNFIRVTKCNLTICKVAKSGCTFLSILALILEKNLQVEEAFKIRRSDIHKIVATIQQHNPESFMTTNIVVSRDPYSRLFSAFIDKYFLLKHQMLYQVSAHFFGKGDYMTMAGKCGFNITFEDWLDRIVTDAFQNKIINQHWCPVYYSCRVCDVDYDIIIQQETLNRDMEHIINRLNISDEMKNKLVTEMNGPGTREMLQGVIKTYLSLFDWKWMRQHCKNKVAYLMKIWEALKIQGYIRTNIPFPLLKFNDNNSVNVESVTKAVLVAMNTNPLSSTERRMQRRQSLVKAYENIPKRIITKIQELYKMDFLLFGYDINPPS